MHRRALLIALCSALVAGTLFVLYVKRFEQESSGGERVRVLVLLKAVERGKPVTDDALGVREIPQAYVEDRAVREGDRAKVVGLRVGGLVQAQQTLMWTDLAVASEERRELSALVQPGRRAVSARFRSDGSGTLIRPGDYVDVISVGARSGSAGADTKSARVLLQRVLVLAVDGSTLAEAADFKDGRAQGALTLSVALPEAQLLAVATENAVLSVALRSAEDSHTAARIPDMVLASTAPEAAPSDARSARRLPTEMRGNDGIP